MCTILRTMASWKLVFSFNIAFLFIFFLSPFHAASNLDVDDANNSFSVSSQKVNLSVYYETLSQSSANFIVQNLTSIFNNDLINIINLRMVPWGNAHVNKTNNNTICENGPDECQLNTIQACAINVLDPVDKYYGLIYCIEFLVIEGRHQDWETCFTSLGLPDKPVLDCYKNGNGTKLQLLYANETAHLNPPHTLMPWVVVNDQPLRNNYGNFTTYVCNAYKGNVTTRACKSRPPNISSIKKAIPFPPVLNRGEG